MGKIIVQGVVRGLAALHGAHWAHLDLKAHNIVCDITDEGWNTRLCDVGSAHFVEDGEPPPRSGTSGWTAPEILYPPPGSLIDARLADVFSFGVVVWEVLSGPAARLNPLSHLAGLRYCEALRAGQRPSFTNGAMERGPLLAAKCWAFEARDRPSLEEIIDEIDHGGV